MIRRHVQTYAPRLCLAAGMLLLAASLVPALAQASLSGAEIKRLVSGRSASWVRGDGNYSGTITYHPDGRLVSQLKLFGTMTTLEGTWEIKGDRFCRTVRMDPTPTRCQSVVRVSGKTYRFLNEDGSLATTTTFR